MSVGRDRILEFLYQSGLIRPAYLALTLLRGLYPHALFSSLSFLLSGSPDGLPIPPFWLRVQVAGTANASDFYHWVLVDADSISVIVENQKVDIRSLDSVLDFGCGCGRLIRHLPRRTDAALFGTDTNARLVSWCDSNLPFAIFLVNGLEPPLSFPDGKFDFA